MALTNSYLVTTKNLEAFFNALTTAQAPERFTLKFLENLEFKSSNDRLYLGVLKSLGFIDENGVPLERYFRFLDQSESKRVLAEGIKEAYGDLFAIRTNANELTPSEVKNKLKTLTQGKKTDNVIGLMANTFNALCSYAEWQNIPLPKTITEVPQPENKDAKPPIIATTPKEKDASIVDPKKIKTELHYNIQIHLPESRDPAVYDAIFKSLREHLD